MDVLTFGNTIELTHLPCDYVRFEFQVYFRGPRALDHWGLSQLGSLGILQHSPLEGHVSKDSQVTRSQTRCPHHPLVIPDSLQHPAVPGFSSPCPASGLRLVFCPSTRQNCRTKLTAVT